jgi:oligopeptide/dipeptide ABC transporter ATP-binding protein
LVTVVDHISFKIPIGKITAIIGESGAGKTQTGLALSNLLPKNGICKMNSQPPLKQFLFSFIFQDPLNALNPLMKIGSQIKEGIRRQMDSGEKTQFIINILNELEISHPEKRINQYPHELSGGMRQRILIAMALAMEPDILIADEPATALDSRIKFHVIQLLKSICETMKKTIIYITHDLASIQGFADEIFIMYAGKIVEYGPTNLIFHKAKHPYTKQLIDLSQKLKIKGENLPYIRGLPPDVNHLPDGCRFYPRCDMGIRTCQLEIPKLTGTEKHQWACPVKN